MDPLPGIKPRYFNQMSAFNMDSEPAQTRKYVEAQNDFVNGTFDEVSGHQVLL